MSGAAGGVATAAAVRAVAAQRAIIGGDAPDNFAIAWAEMAVDERAFWLQFSRLSRNLATWNWSAIPGDKRCILKNNIYRGAQRLQIVAAALS